MSQDLDTTRTKLRRFGLAFGSGLTLLGGLLWWREKAAAPYVLGVVGVVILLALVWPRGLSPIERVFSRVARAVTAALTYVVLTLTFFLVITPIGLLMRLLGKDSLAMRADPERESFWIAVEPDGPTTRPDKPY